MNSNGLQLSGTLVKQLQLASLATVCFKNHQLYSLSFCLGDDSLNPLPSGRFQQCRIVNSVGLIKARVCLDFIREKVAHDFSSLRS